jgi:hypothetical protein
MQHTEANLTAQDMTWAGETPVVDDPRSWLSRRLVWERRLAQLERTC